jgi:hypothetical protein
MLLHAVAVLAYTAVLRITVPSSGDSRGEGPLAIYGG